ncbi:MAG TPA: hypothetical protein VFF21_07855 [Flavobacteriaceae bacterium]|nr:hypothetical protein [Flavobacteriaceae bacterium]
MKKQIRKHLKLIAEQLLDHEEDFATEKLKKEVLELYNRLVVLEYFESLIEAKEEVEEQVPGTSETDTVSESSIATHDIPDGTVTAEKLEDPDFNATEDKSDDSVLQESSLKNTVEEKVTEESLPANDVSPFELEEEEHENSDESFESKDGTVGDSDDTEETTPLGKTYQNELELFAASYQRMPEFERKSDAESRRSPSAVSESHSEPVEHFVKDEKRERSLIKEDPAARPKSLNDVLNRGLNIGLNDRLAFIKHLFEGRSEDYARVLSQLETFGTFEEAAYFIKHTVKPDYNHWNSKEEYEFRFMAIVEKKFGV